MRKYIALTIFVFFSLCGYSQSQVIYSQMRDYNIFQHLDASISLGTTGIGFDVSSPIGDYVNLRAGFDFVPQFHHHMHFGVQVGNDPNTSGSKFNRLSGLLSGLTGFKVDNQIEMIGKPTMKHFKLLFDIFPLRNDKRFHITAGFYLGSSQIAEAYNSTEDMPSLMAVSIYNNLYNKVSKGEPIYDNEYLDPDIEDRILYYGRMAMHIGDYSHDIYDANGNLVHAKGDSYMMEPDANSMCSAEVKVQSFKPYLGLGYGGRLFKKSDKYHVAIDCGILFWGGKPKIITHDGTDLVNDVENISGKVGDYVDLIKVFNVYPILNVRFTKAIF